ncbi:ROK family protein [Leifsonia sp. C5G2]|uniref:ROK family protein n=1 Tax=Leifsonia sp. C5G2 TaxID=2735269 RepID=UPI0015846F25|nr:ROK family protein [Leifsonia sp. C5G2]
MRIGIDVGGTKTESVGLDDRGTVVAHDVRPTGFGLAAVVATVQASVDELVRQSEASRAPASVGVGIPGLVDPRTGTLLHAVNLGIDEVRLGEELAGSLGVPVSIENDVNAAALGAYRALSRDALRPLRSLAFLNVGTGLAAGIVVGGMLLSGANGTAGEIGHIPVRSDGPRCRCGQTGCLEAIASGHAVATRWPSSAEHPVLELFRASRQGDPLAGILTRDMVDGIAAAIRMLVVAFDVEQVVVGGGLTRVGAELQDPVLRRLRSWEGDSPFLRALDVPGRVAFGAPIDAVAAVGAALLEVSA